MSWTDERVEQLKNLWGQGSSASQIAKILGGVTRNAVIGKAHRLGLSGGTKPALPRAERAPREHGHHRHRSEGRSHPKLVVPPSPPPIPIEELEVPPEADRINLLKLSEKMCKWPIGNPGDATFRFCGRSAEAGTP